MKKGSGNSSLVQSGENGSMTLHSTAFRRTTMICEEETLVEYMTNEQAWNRLSCYVDMFKKHR